MKFLNFLCLVAILALSLSCKQQPKAETARFVVLSPEVAEILCELGAEEDIVGITTECNYPSSLASKPIVGSFSSINKEQIIAVKPGIIFCSALEQEGAAADLKKLGYRVEVVYPKSLAMLSQEILRIGKLIGKEPEARALNLKMDSELAELKAKNTNKPRPRVYLEIYRDPLMSVSDASFVGELIETAGGDNLFPTLERDYARVNPEAVIKAKPEIMICFSRDTLQNIISRKGWQDIPAIQSKSIYFEREINPDLIQRATPRCIEGIRALQVIFDAWRAKP
ncbi:MAG: helical backbone metal receptor [Candidatus Cloacimonas sp.]|jgi:iron complex transport system substrate-binding protein|nr:helical backbone metal receptor [Candidatus Cloacimonas sp.]